MNDFTKKIIAGAGIIVFTGAAATGGYYFAKYTEKNSDQNEVSSLSDAADDYEYDDEYDDNESSAYDFSEMINYISLGEYKGVKATTFVPTLDDIDEETIESDMEYYMEDYREFTEVTDRGIKEGDTVTLSYTVSIDGKDIEDLAIDDYEVVIGDEMLFDELEDKLIGLKSGENTVAEVTHPEDFEYEEYANEKATYTIDISSVQECTYEPQLTDEFVKEKIDGCETLDDWREVIKAEELEVLKTEAKEQLSNDVYTEVLNTTTFTDYEGLLKAYPSVYEDIHSQVMEEYEYYAEMFGMDVEEYMAEFADVTEADIEEEVKNNIKGEIMLQAIIAKEGLELTEDEFNEFVNKSYKEYECETAEEFIDYYSRETIEEVCLSQKCHDFLAENAIVTEISYDEYMNMTESEEDDDIDDSIDDDSDGDIDDSSDGDIDNSSDDDIDDDSDDDIDDASDSDAESEF